MSQVSKVGEMYLGTTRNASKPIEQASKTQLALRL